MFYAKRLRVVTVALCIIFLFSLILIPFANADWIMFRSDPSHSGAGTGNSPLTPSIQVAEASETVYIRPDGSFDPLSAPIQPNPGTLGIFSNYTFASNITGSIVVQGNNIVIDGAGYTLLGPGGIFGTTAIVLNGSDITIKNLKVMDFYHGIVSNGYSGHKIYGMEISDITLAAISLISSSYNTISDNFINLCYDAIIISYSSGNEISGNNIARLNGGISLQHTSNNVISRNNITGGLAAGINLVDSDFSSLSGNYIYSGFDGISLLDSDHNDVSLNYLNQTRSEGVKLSNSSENTISGNNITYNYADGVALFDSLSNKIYGNNIDNNGGGSLIGSSGIRLNASQYNIVSGNNVTDNWPYFGVWLNYSSDNIFYHNIFINNTEHVHSSYSTNVWDNGYPSGGNYWSNYTGTDGNHDGIGDTPYIIDSNNQDRYPLMTPWTGQQNSYLIVRGSNNQIFERICFGATAVWSSWTGLPGQTGDPPAAAVIANELHIVVRGANNDQIWHAYINLADNSFSGWELLSGATPSAPTLTSNSTVLSLVVRGGDNRIYYRFYTIATQTWTSWSTLPSGTTLETPAAALVGDTLHIVVKGSDGATLWYSNINPTTNAFSGWTLLSGSTPSIPTLTSNGTTLSLVVRGGDNRIYYRFYTIASQTWTSWNALPSGTTPDAPGATIIQNTLWVVVRGSDGTSLWTSNLNLGTSAFSGWTLLSGSTPSKPTLTS